MKQLQKPIAMHSVAVKKLYTCKYHLIEKWRVTTDFDQSKLIYRPSRAGVAPSRLEYVNCQTAHLRVSLVIFGGMIKSFVVPKAKHKRLLVLLLLCEVKWHVLYLDALQHVVF